MSNEAGADLCHPEIVKTALAVGFKEPTSQSLRIGNGMSSREPEQGI
jgi:hypothetical protein